MKKDNKSQLGHKYVTRILRGVVDVRTFPTLLSVYEDLQDSIPYRLYPVELDNVGRANPSAIYIEIDRFGNLCRDSRTLGPLSHFSDLYHPGIARRLPHQRSQGIPDSHTSCDTFQI